MTLQLKITDPAIGQSIHLIAKNEFRNGIDGWRVTMNDRTNFFISMQTGQWKVVEGRRISNDLLDAIGLFLHPLAIGNLFNYQVHHN